MRSERRYRISQHAIERFQQRVGPLPDRAARAAIRAIASTGHRRSRPRHWMREAATAGVDPGGATATFVYNFRIPDLCLLLRGDTIVTVYSRADCRRWRAQEPVGPRTRRRLRIQPGSATVRRTQLANNAHRNSDLSKEDC